MNTNKSKLAVAAVFDEEAANSLLTSQKGPSIGHLAQQLLLGDAMIRLPQVLAVVPVSRSGWFQGIREGRYPKGIKISSRTTAWRVSDIAALLQSFNHGNGGDH
jgi:prophage regulatory protein